MAAKGVSEPLQLTLQAAAQIRGLIIDRVLLPGEKIRQVDLAERIGVSRSPLREALRTLEAEGAVAYEVNRGYVVARLDDDDLAQIHHMRAILEGELLRTIVPGGVHLIGVLTAANERLRPAIEARDIAEVLRLNREFHFAIFNCSPLNQFRREVTRLWQLSEGYSVSWWWRTTGAADRIDREHRAIMRAIEDFDIDRLVSLCEAHMTGGFDHALAARRTGLR